MDDLSIDDLLEEAQRTAIESIPENTRRAYATDWNQYRNWCQKRSRVPLPATTDTVSAYLTALAKTHAIATLRRRLTMISKAHRISGKPDPAADVRVKQLWRGILHSKGEAPRGKKPLLVPDLRRMVDALPKTLQGDRDRALLLLGFAAASSSRSTSKAWRRSRRGWSSTSGGARPTRPGRASGRESRSGIRRRRARSGP